MSNKLFTKKYEQRKVKLYDKIIQWYLEEETLTLEDIDLHNFPELKEFLTLLNSYFNAPTKNPLTAYVSSLRYKISMLEQLIELVEAHSVR